MGLVSAASKTEVQSVRNRDAIVHTGTSAGVTWTITDPSQLDFFTLDEIDNNHYILKNRSISIQFEGVQPGECEFFLV